MSKQNSYRFHGYYDVKVLPFLGNTRTVFSGTRTIQKHFTIQERELSYRFYPHFHPYVGPLIKRLIQKSV